MYVCCIGFGNTRLYSFVVFMRMALLYEVRSLFLSLSHSKDPRYFAIALSLRCQLIHAVNRLPDNKNGSSVEPDYMDIEDPTLFHSWKNSGS